MKTIITAMCLITSTLCFSSVIDSKLNEKIKSECNMSNGFSYSIDSIVQTENDGDDAEYIANLIIHTDYDHIPPKHIQIQLRENLIEGYLSILSPLNFCL